MILGEFTGRDKLKFSVHKVTTENLDEFKTFLEECGNEGADNNSSLSKIKFGKWGDEEAWGVIKHKDKMISMSAAHYLPHVSPKCYMIAYRVYTLKPWRGTASGTKDHRLLNEFHHRAIQPYAVDWCIERGATKIVTAVNTILNTVPDPSGLEYKFSRVARIMFPKENKYTLIHKDLMLYNRYQDVYELHYRDFNTMEKL